MGLQYILSQVGNKTGLDPADESQRATLLRIINEGAKELYDETDMVGSLMECLFKVNGDQTIAFPSYVGDLRAARPFDTQVPIHINQMRPRYNVVNWADSWRNYRIKNKQPLHTSVRNEAQVTITVHAVENPPIEVTVAGPTENSERFAETVVMDATSKTTSQAFLDIVMFSKNRINDYNVYLSDVDGMELSKIPNDQLRAEFLIIDVSTYPYANNDGGSYAAHWVETLYKKRLPVLSRDTDEFMNSQYDNVIVNKALQIYFEEQEKVDIALVHDGKATRTMGRIMKNENKATEDMISMVPNPHDEILTPIRPHRPGWFPRNRTL